MATDSRFNAWDVYIGRRWIDKVFFLKDCSAEYVRSALVNHDGYNPNIKVYCR